MGISFTTDIEYQATIADPETQYTVTGPSKWNVTVQKILPNGPSGNFDQDAGQFQMGDLLYISPTVGGNTAKHVITWMGKVDGSLGDYLVIDSHDELNVQDKGGTGNYIPTGVQLRPFLPPSYPANANAWTYYRNLMYGIRFTMTPKGQ